MTKGIDISQWQETVDFKKVKGNIDFAILREGYRKVIDPRFLEYVKGCRENAIAIPAVYHFTYATNSAEAREEAKACIANVEKAGLPKSTIIFYDFEYDTVEKAKAKGITLGKSECILFTNTFCSYVQGQGYRAGVYSNVDYYRNMYDKATVDKYVFWLADYSGKADLPCVYHQYTSGGTVPGIIGKVDMDYYYGEADAPVGKVRMSNCGHDERNKYSGGQAGDQTGNEWYLREWYSYPWNYVLRWKDPALGDLCADLAVEAAENPLIGYDQNQRDTFWSHLKASNYHPGQITIPCEADCSSGTIAIIKAVGYLKGLPVLQKCSATYTGNMLEWAKGAGKSYFEVLTGRYLTSPSLARRGDINLNTVHHVNITVDNGTQSGSGTGTGSTGGSILKRGSSGEAVKKLQEMLIACGYSVGPDGADGDFGAKTESAVKLFQKNYGLSADGQYGPLTQTKLEAVYKAQTSKKSIEEVAQEVLEGKWGNGAERKKKLEAAGYDYAKVQAAVNRLLS